MKKQSLLLVSPFLAAILILGTLSIMPAPVGAHDGEDHSNETTSEHPERVEQMQALVKILQQLVILLTEQVQATAARSDSHADEMEADDHAEGHGYTELTITAEEHGGRTHIHVYQPEEDEMSFFLEDLALSEEAAIIAAIAVETGLTETEVEAAVSFASSDIHDDEAGHEEDEDHESDHEEDELAGIHIMADGTIMLGSGEEVEDATITDDGMILLSDGSTVEPAFDLR